MASTWLLSVDTSRVDLYRCAYQNHPKSLKTRLSIPHLNSLKLWLSRPGEKLELIYCFKTSSDVQMSKYRTGPFWKANEREREAHHWVSLFDNNLHLCVSFLTTTGYLSIFTHFLCYYILELNLLNDSRPVWLQWNFAFPNKRILSHIDSSRDLFSIKKAGRPYVRHKRHDFRIGKDKISNLKIYDRNCLTKII